MSRLPKTILLNLIVNFCSSYSSSLLAYLLLGFYCQLQGCHILLVFLLTITPSRLSSQASWLSNSFPSLLPKYLIQLHIFKYYVNSEQSQISMSILTSSLTSRFLYAVYSLHLEASQVYLSGFSRGNNSQQDVYIQRKTFI